MKNWVYYMQRGLQSMWKKKTKKENNISWNRNRGR